MPNDHTKLHFQARVISGKRLGKDLGFPTANLDSDPNEFPAGVFVVRVVVQEKWYWGLMHCGPRDTVDLPASMEVWIEDFDGDLYGETITVMIIKKLRDVKKFSGLQALHEAIAADVAALQQVKG